MRLVGAGARILSGRIAQVLANAAVVFIVAKTLGPRGQGHYSLTVAVAQLSAALLAGGMGLAAVPPLRRNRLPAARMVGVQGGWTLTMGVLLFAGASLTAGGAAGRFLAEHLGWPRELGYAVALGATGLLTFEVFSFDLLARGRLVIGSAINGWRAAGHLVVVAGVALAGALGFAQAVGVFALAQCAGAAVLVGVVLREIRRPWPRTDAVAPPPGPVRERDLPADLAAFTPLRLVWFNLRRGWLGQFSAVAYFLLLRLDQGILARYHGAEEVGVYSLAVHVGEMLWLLPGALTPLLVHTSAADADDPERDRTAARAVRLGLAVTLLAAVPLALLAGPLLPLMAGGAYAGAVPALRALLPGIVAFAPGAVLAGDFIGRGRPHWNTQASLLTVAVNLAVGLMWIPDHGAVGAAWASTVAYTCGSGLMLIRFVQALREDAADRA